MLLIIGGAHDMEAHSVVARLGCRRAAILDASDLSQPGWRLFTDAPAEGAVVAGGRVVPVRDVTAILVRRLAVYPQELGHVHPDDRTYVAGEMTALLAWWLRTVPVPVFNRSTGAALCGPGWRAEQWRAHAGRLGFPVTRLRRTASVPTLLPPVATELVRVGEMVLGKAQLQQAECLRELARTAGISLLYGAFDADGALVTAHTLPQLSEELIEVVEQSAAEALKTGRIAAGRSQRIPAGTMLAGQPV